MGGTQKIFASYVGRGDRFEDHAALRGQALRKFVCELISELVLYIDYRQGRKARHLLTLVGQ
ncbi:hypothetical protein [Mycobacteroides abscessus]|uniref:hypothetical protein n=1 Tax=Mycobacteroides abscessus TaxID=36809 RepID=UPI000927AFFD|nr:hypothetical protein [Mycobacteroides abscessus]MBN7332951.1 hypothetical protein [Mycobacteroides abscessus subsp. abscessus]MDM2401933.1 hypothetical protein [Mycobacteroides abscessus]MDM2412070.1 hypothetical protein [Mycobacteroides abscessus]SHP44041.1 Uncharacterised protein [Mycobacteroides abscessus subsp. abscessus]SIE76789.1 Uncharacterised protein [Mycobacteroides abscessus subsp. abscessus]